MNEKTYEIRLASADDIPAIVMIYDAVLTREEQGQYSIGWIRGIYPTADTAAKAVSCRDMFVLEANAKIIASARINQEQMPAYASVSWT